MGGEKKQSYIKESLSLMGQTLPLLGLNALVYLVFFVVAVIWTVIWVGLTWLAIQIHWSAAFFTISIAGGAFWWAWRIARQYILYLVKGAHIAAITELMCNRDVPGGTEQIKYGQKIVKDYFKDVSILFGLDMLIRAIVRGVTGAIASLLKWLPLPGKAKKLVDTIRKIIVKSLDYVDAAILSYAIRQRDDNVWQSARHGIILYAQSYKQILWTSVKAYAIGKVLDLLIFAMIMAPFVGIAYMMDFMGGAVFYGGLVVGAIATKTVELALYQPFAHTYIMVTYHYETEGVEPNKEWDQKLQNMSNKFKELVGKAENYEPEEDDTNGPDALPDGQQPDGGLDGSTSQPEKQPVTSE